MTDVDADAVCVCKGVAEYVDAEDIGSSDVANVKNGDVISGDNPPVTGMDMDVAGVCEEVIPIAELTVSGKLVFCKTDGDGVSKETLPLPDTESMVEMKDDSAAGGIAPSGTGKMPDGGRVGEDAVVEIVSNIVLTMEVTVTLLRSAGDIVPESVIVVTPGPKGAGTGCTPPCSTIVPSALEILGRVAAR